MRSRYELNLRAMLGPSSHGAVTILNRTISWNADGITYNAYRTHFTIIMRQMAL